MTTETKPEVKAGWTEVEEKVIAHFHESGMTRSNAVRKMRQLAAKGVAPEAMLDTKGHDESPSKAQVAKQDKAIARVNKVAEAKRGKTERADAKHLRADKLEEIDRIARKQAGCAIEAKIKSSLNPDHGQRYIWFGTEKGQVVHVNVDDLTTRFLADDSGTVKAWRKRQATEVKRIEKAAKAK